ncbi:asialoglycoprotein receptor 1-like isoform X2 [Rana temporaria]|uniref:asialoglycoprotein receptor 1-like isoform X2 n=1 Tax=Rana temporaria TaxID=8407 RepID=UPI001AACD8EB|nr:asialoglycoprotein receptor 1-like isoform X2 [Rana temporaria]
MPVRYKDVELLPEEDPTPNKSPTGNHSTSRGLTMNRWIPQPSSGLICSLSALCTGLLFIIIILIVTITRQGVDQTEKNMEVKLRNLSLGVDSKVEKLSQNGSYANDIQRVLGAVARLTEEIRKGNNSTDLLCDVGWRQYAFSCYYLSQYRRTWESAKKDCETRGAHLVVINGEDENRFVGSLSNWQTSWIGLTDVDGSWKWVDGTSYDDTPKFWMPGQPDEWINPIHSQGEDCAELHSSGGWNDGHCSLELVYICEKELH